MSGRLCSAVFVFLFLLLFLLLLALGCADSKKPPADAGHHDGGIATGHGACWSGTICDSFLPNTVRSCDKDGVPGMVVQTCGTGMTCSYGRCVSSSCGAVESASQRNVTGCLFYTAMLDNVDSDDGKPTLIIVTNSGQSSTMVRLEERAAGLPWTTAQSIPIAASSAGSMTVADRHIEGAQFGLALARRVISDTPVTVMVVQSDDADHNGTSSSGTMLLPFHVLGFQYMAMTYQQVATPEVQAIVGARGGAGEIAIVAVQDRTLLQIRRPALPITSMPQMISLDGDGDVYQMVSDDEGDDLAGTTIISDKPVAVFSGNVATTYGKASTAVNSPDMAMEQMMPTPNWSRRYVAANLPPQISICGSLFPDGPSGYWRLLASADTDVTFTSHAPLPPSMIGPVHVSRASPFTFVVPGGSDFVAHADALFLLTQGMDCEATLSNAIPVDAPESQQLFALPPNFDHVLGIVRRYDSGASRVTLDDTDITDRFKPVDDEFAVASIPVPACLESIAHCMHRLVGAFGLTVRGMDIACSYATTYPSWANCGSVDTCP